MLCPPTFEHLGVLQVIKHLHGGKQMLNITTRSANPGLKELKVETNHSIADKWQHAPFQKKKGC
tara:strand:+ start:286 stop:477 length:192 start_codon:yes stop_codon:yes gene_type:complete